MPPGRGAPGKAQRSTFTALTLRMVELTTWFTSALSLLLALLAPLESLIPAKHSTLRSRVSSSDTLRMTGFAGRARGHDQHLLKTP